MKVTGEGATTATAEKTNAKKGSADQRQGPANPRQGPANPRQGPPFVTHTATGILVVTGCFIYKNFQIIYLLFGTLCNIWCQ